MCAADLAARLELKRYARCWRGRCATDRQTGFLMPPTIDEWLPQRHVAHFVVEVVDGLDLRAMSEAYRGSGLAAAWRRALARARDPCRRQVPGRASALDRRRALRTRAAGRIRTTAGQRHDPGRWRRPLSAPSPQCGASVTHALSGLDLPPLVTLSWPTGARPLR